jgi:hypothetical protein
MILEDRFEVRGEPDLAIARTLLARVLGAIIQVVGVALAARHCPVFQERCASELLSANLDGANAGVAARAGRVSPGAPAGHRLQLLSESSPPSPSGEALGSRR